MKLSAALVPSLAAALLCAAALNACGSDPAPPIGGDAGADDAGASDAGPGACTATASYGTVTPRNETASYSPSDTDGGYDDDYLYKGDLNADANVDYLDIELYGSDGAFADGVATGTYTLSGDDLNFGTCGLCLLIYTDDNPDTQMATDSYFATGGTVTITSLYPMLAGTLTNVTFQHVTIDDTTYTSTPVNDGCVSTITSLDFSADDTVSPRHLRGFVRKAPARR